MKYEELISELRQRQALIVHFSHHACMRDGGVFPADLHAAALNSRLWALSCCLVWPSHSMSLPGSVGLVLHPRCLASIVSVKASDSGSLTNPNGEEDGLGEPLDQSSFDRSFNVEAGAYNEWRVKESDVIGVYFEGDGRELYAKKYIFHEDTETGMPIAIDIGIKIITLAEVHESFPDLPVYTRIDGKIMATNIPGSVIYPWSLTGHF